MADKEWDDADIAGASAALDEELEKILSQARGLLGEDPEKPPEAEIPPDDDDLPLAEIIDDEPPEKTGPISREELADIISASVERGVLAALKKIGKI